LLPSDAQRATFWRDTVARDAALVAVRHTTGFAGLRRQYAGHAPEGKQ
jgi:hypothetical protein